MKLKPLLLLLMLIFLPKIGSAASLYENFPTEIYPNERYVFYVHGLIVEGSDAKPIHKEYGVYDFPAIKSVLFDDGNFNLIAHHRSKDTEINQYVDQIVIWVNKLIDHGVSPSRITLVGFSRGSHLVAFASGKLKNAGINTALLGSCFSGDIVTNPPISLGGNLLSIYEASDKAGSCSQLAKRSALNSFAEIEINTGKKHGAFFMPLDNWMIPLKKWIQHTNR